MKKRLTAAILFLATFLIFVYVRPYEFLPLLFIIQTKINLARILIIISLIFCFFERSRKSFIIKEPSFRLFLSLQLLAVALIPFAYWQYNSFQYWSNSFLKVFITFLLITIAANNERKISLLINTIFWCCSFVALRVVVSFWVGNVIIAHDGTPRVVGVSTLASNNPNDIALVLAMAIPIGLYLTYVNRSKFKKLLFLSSTIFIGYAVLYTGSRGGYLGVLTGIIAFFSLIYRRRKFKLVMFVLCAALILLTVLPGEYKSRFMSIFDSEGYSYTNERVGRVAIWKRGLLAFRSNPLGVGIKNFSLAEGAQKQEEGVIGKWMVAHNAYIQIGVELGVLGLILYLFFLISGFMSVKRIVYYAQKLKNYRYHILAYGLTASLVTFMISSMFLSVAYYWNQYIFIAILVALKNVLRKEAEKMEGNE